MEINIYSNYYETTTKIEKKKNAPTKSKILLERALQFKIVKACLVVGKWFADRKITKNKKHAHTS